MEINCDPATNGLYLAIAMCAVGLAGAFLLVVFVRKLRSNIEAQKKTGWRKLKSLGIDITAHPIHAMMILGPVILGNMQTFVIVPLAFICILSALVYGPIAIIMMLSRC